MESVTGDQSTRRTSPPRRCSPRPTLCGSTGTCDPRSRCFIPGAATIEGLTVRFEGGRAVEIDADKGVEILRTMTARDEGACRLGEVALVDRESRSGRAAPCSANTLLDENAASHIALGAAYPFSVEDEDDKARVNTQ